jgi:hypothetical protein
MPVSPDDGVSLAKGMLDLYADAEARLLELIGRTIADGITEPGWRERQLRAVQRMRRQTAKLLADLERAATAEAQAEILAAYNRGAALAGLDVGGTAAASFGGVQASAVSALVQATTGQLTSTGLLIASQQEAIYRDVVAKVAGQSLTEGLTGRQAAWQAMQLWADRGITGFTDRAGRAWEMSAYAEMTMRTATAQATIQGHVDRLTGSGRDLGMVSDAPEECEKCRPWEGKVLSLSGQTPAGEHSEDGTRYTVAGTVSQARAAGLFHPNCRHRMVIFIPGVTRPLLDTEDPEGDRTRQAQRYRERRIRQLKRRELAAKAIGDEQAVRKSTGQLRAAQAEFKAWRDEHGRRDYGRQSIRVPTPRPQPAAKPKRTPRTPPPDVIDWNTRELRAASDDDLAEALGRAYTTDHPNTNRLEAELDRRDSAPYREQERREKRNEAARAKRAANLEAQHAEVGRLIDQGWDPRDAVATVTGVSVEKQLRTELTMRLRAEGTPGKSLDDMISHRFEQERARMYVQAEDATRGHMLTPQGEAKGIDPYALFHGPEARARRWASPELKEWWDQHGRLTRDDYKQQLLTGGLGLGERVDDFLT